jgi:hypothetical protein
MLRFLGSFYCVMSIKTNVKSIQNHLQEIKPWAIRLLEEQKLFLYFSAQSQLSFQSMVDLIKFYPFNTVISMTSRNYLLDQLLLQS